MYNLSLKINFTKSVNDKNDLGRFLLRVSRVRAGLAWASEEILDAFAMTDFLDLIRNSDEVSAETVGNRIHLLVTLSHLKNNIYIIFTIIESVII